MPSCFCRQSSRALFDVLSSDHFRHFEVVTDSARSNASRHKHVRPLPHQLDGSPRLPVDSSRRFGIRRQRRLFHALGQRQDYGTRRLRG
ncbi:hypothetical protein L596_013635 [Steinernema carpocapsae]|uniref:Uncharacterized protein n=1 Tax=Steinernema carpocapsae TaxID=34508 RepID=A0A4U5P0W8_STECR|nr:hypothetical protein L596_013635 [Steinernema carpocapsae]